MKQIPIYCHFCKQQYLVNRTSEIPEKTVLIHCNYCHNCEYEMFKNRQDYCEWYDDNELEFQDPNQLKLEL